MKLSLIGAFLSSLGIALMMIPSIIKVAEQKKLFDIPHSRRAHETSTPTLGGVSFFAGFVFSLLFWIGSHPFPELRYIICAIIVLFFVGMKDDILYTVHYKKLLGQIIAAAIILHWGGVRLTSFYGLFGVYDIPTWLSYSVTLITIVGITNSFNFIDGIDSLAGLIGLISTAFFGFWFLDYGFHTWSMLAFSLAGSIIGFLFYNRTPAKIFMGDTGALILGIICSVMAIKFIEINKVHTFVQSAPTIALVVLIVPIFDSLRVICIRLYARANPFQADRNHLHHLLTDLGFSHMQCAGFLGSFNILAIVFVYSQQNFGEHFGLDQWSAELLLLFVFLGLGGVSYGLSVLRRKKGVGDGKRNHSITQP